MSTTSGQDSTFVSHAGRGLLDRRRFLAQTGTGLSAIALAHLLRRDGVLGASSSFRPAIDPAHPLGSAAATAGRKGQERLGAVLLRRLQPSRYLGLQAGADPPSRSAAARRCAACDVSGRERQSRQESVPVSSARPVGKNDVRLVAPFGCTGGRDVLFALAHQPDEHPRSGRELFIDRLYARRIPQRGGLGELRPGDRQQRAAGVRRHSRPARRPAVERQ